MILEAPDAAQANSSSKNTTSSVAPGAAASPTEGAARHDAVLEGSVVVTARASQPANRLAGKRSRAATPTADGSSHQRGRKCSQIMQPQNSIFGAF